MTADRREPGGDDPWDGETVTGRCSWDSISYRVDLPSTETSSTTTLIMACFFSLPFTESSLFLVRDFFPPVVLVYY